MKPSYADAHVNLGCAYKELNRIEEALACFDLALRLEPHLRSARYNRALTRLQSGDWKKGWQDYESRWGRKNQPNRLFEQPRWDGSGLSGKTLLIWCEQGLGDAILFLRFAPLLKDRGARVIVECPPPLTRLFASCSGIGELVEEGKPLPCYDMQVPLMSLPSLLDITPENVPPQRYLSAEPDRVKHWQEVLGSSTSLRVGVVWQGNPRFEWDRWRSAPLQAFAPLAEIEGVELISLQKGPGEEQIESFQKRLSLRRLEGLDADAPFVDTAAVLGCLDLLVCVDTSIGHLAGALGVPVWLALSTVGDWRWMRDREETPWYSKHRLFRQKQAGAWTEVFARMAVTLGQQGQQREKSGTLSVPTAAGEVLDRLSILLIKSQRIKEESRLCHVLRELTVLQHIAGHWLIEEEARRLFEQLTTINERLWDVEDALRDCEAARDFSQRFVELARSVYRLNDERAGFKRQVNAILGAAWSDQKQYGTANS